MPRSAHLTWSLNDPFYLAACDRYCHLRRDIAERSDGRRKDCCSGYSMQEDDTPIEIKLLTCEFGGERFLQSF
jgi:hypothetical protein